MASLFVLPPFITTTHIPNNRLLNFALTLMVVVSHSSLRIGVSVFGALCMVNNTLTVITVFLLKLCQ